MVWQIISDWKALVIVYNSTAAISYTNNIVGLQLIITTKYTHTLVHLISVAVWCTAIAEF